MKKHVFLTSLIAISMSCAAHAATDRTDVTFSGKYLTDSDTSYDVKDGKQSITEYTYVTGKDGEGNDITTTKQLANGETPAQEPEKTEFKYTTPDGTADLTAEELPVAEDYTGSSVVSGEDYANGDKVKIIEDGTDFNAGTSSIAKENYSYLESETENGKGVWKTFGDEMNAIESTHKLSNGTELTLKNGKIYDGDREVTLAEDGTVPYGAYQGTLNGKTYRLSDDGSTLVDNDGFGVSVVEGEAQELLTQLKEQHDMDASEFPSVFDDHKAAYDFAKGNYDLAKEAFEADSEQLADLQDKFATVGQAQDYYNAALKAKEDAETKATNLGDAYDNAVAVFDAPILDTIDGQIEASVQNDGVIANAIKDSQTETLTSANEYADAGDAKTLESANKYADAGDAKTLTEAMAYTDSKNAASLREANAYTDKKVDELEKDMSAGIASANAMSSIEVSNVGKGEVSVGGGYGYYNSQSAVAFGAAMGLTDKWSVNAAAGLADSNVSFRAGTNYKFKLF